MDSKNSTTRQYMNYTTASNHVNYYILLFQHIKCEVGISFPRNQDHLNITKKNNYRRELVPRLMENMN